MIIKMRNYEKQAVDNAKQYKEWDNQIIAKDSYLNGYRNALLDVSENYYNNIVGFDPVTTYDIISDSFNILDIGSEDVEVEFKDGQHQLVDDIRIV